MFLKKNTEFVAPDWPLTPLGTSEKEYKQGHLEALRSIVELPVVLLQKEFDRKYPGNGRDRITMRWHLTKELLRMILGLPVGRLVRKHSPEVVDRAWQRYSCTGPKRVPCGDPPIMKEKCSVEWLSDKNAPFIKRTQSSPAAIRPLK